MRIGMFVQQVDERDWLRAFTLDWIRALAARVEHVEVITLEQGKATLPANVAVHSMGKEHGYGRGRELLEYYRALGRIIRRVDVLFCHMTPRYTWLATPLAAIFRKPQVLWYTHRQDDWELRLALAACRYVTTAVPDSFPIPSAKVRALGHGIDNNFFAPDPKVQPASPPLIVHVARLMPIKHQATLLRALAAGVEAQAAIVGAVPQGQDDSYPQQLQTLAESLGIADRVQFTGGIAANAVRDLYRCAAIAVNLSPPGLFDKAALESMLTGIPTIVSNPAFDPLLGEYSDLLRISSPDDVQGLVDSLKKVLALPANLRTKMVEEIRLRVAAQHSLDGLMDRLVALMESAIE
ncbi:MAG TPA: glycosyltransferase family 4 protein [Aggregatilineales bacterium]|nr:glycosyltransferase family 4 protein [Aggregatilineales bacterium]